MTDNETISCLLVLTIICGYIFHKWSMAAFVALILYVFAERHLVRGACFISFILLLCVDLYRKGKDSVLSKYNIYSRDCILPKWAILVISLIGVAVSILALVGLLLERW